LNLIAPETTVSKQFNLKRETLVATAYEKHNDEKEFRYPLQFRNMHLPCDACILYDTKNTKPCRCIDNNNSTSFIDDAASK
jgi:hypothetical protein